MQERGAVPQLLGKESTREGFARGVLRAAEEDERVVVIGMDVTGSPQLTAFKDRFPKKFISVGIAEQNGAGVAAGLALSGFRPVFATYATFATTRALDQIRVSICYNNAPVVIGGAHAGLSVGPDGATHQALEDIATMRVLPHMKVLTPLDSNQAEAMAYYALRKHEEGPLYIRLGRAAVANFTDASKSYDPAEVTLYRFGEAPRLLLLACGTMLYPTLNAGKELAQEGVSTAVVGASCVKPFDVDAIVRYIELLNVQGVVTVEEHQVGGGFGSIVAEMLSGVRPVKMLRIGVKDSFGESGSPDDLLAKYKLDSAGIAEQVREFTLWGQSGNGVESH